MSPFSLTFASEFNYIFPHLKSHSIKSVLMLILKLLFALIQIEADPYYEYLVERRNQSNIVKQQVVFVKLIDNYCWIYRLFFSQIQDVVS